MEACLKDMGASKGKSEPKMEANQEKTESMTEHYERVLHAEATHVLTALQDWACDVLHADPKGVTYEEIIRETDSQFGDQNLAVESRNHMKTRTQDDSQSPICQQLPSGSSKQAREHYRETNPLPSGRK
jgi:hypothetical protein